MKLLNKSESKIVILACIFTVISVLGFVLMQGNIKSKGNEYVSKKSKLKEIELTTDDYELIKRDKKDNENIFIVLEKRNFPEIDELLSVC